MKIPEIKVRVVHSKKTSAWNITSLRLGDKYKIAVIPYICCGDEKNDEIRRNEAFEHAEFISCCFNNSDAILNYLEKAE